MSSISLVIFILLPFIVYLMSLLYHQGLTFANPEGDYPDYRTHMGVTYITSCAPKKGSDRGEGQDTSPLLIH